MIWCKSQNHAQIATVSKEPRTPDDPSKASGDRLQIPAHQDAGREKFFNPMSQARRTQARHRPIALSQVTRHRETGHDKGPERLQPFKEGFSVVEPKEKTPHSMRVSSEEELTDIPFIAKRSKRPNTSMPTGRHNVCTHVLEDLGL